SSVRILEKYILEKWWHREAVVLLAQYLAQGGRLDEAAEKYRLAGRLDVHNAQPWEQIAIIRMQQGRLDEALAAQQRAVRAEPESAEQRSRLAKLHLARGDEVEA